MTPSRSLWDKTAQQLSRVQYLESRVVVPNQLRHVEKIKWRRDWSYGMVRCRAVTLNFPSAIHKFRSPFYPNRNKYLWFVVTLWFLDRRLVQTCPYNIWQINMLELLPISNLIKITVIIGKSRLISKKIFNQFLQWDLSDLNVTHTNSFYVQFTQWLQMADEKILQFANVKNH